LIHIYRSGGVKQRLYVDNLLSIRVPVASADEQRELADARAAVLDTVRRAEERLTLVEQDVEALITGERILGEPTMP
jgi:hypothetical protein